MRQSIVGAEEADPLASAHGRAPCSKRRRRRDRAPSPSRRCGVFRSSTWTVPSVDPPSMTTISTVEMSVQIRCKAPFECRGAVPHRDDHGDHWRPGGHWLRRIAVAARARMPPDGCSRRPAQYHRHPRAPWLGRTGLRELAGYHELLYFLVWRDLKVRYKQTAFGVAWAVLQPLLLMVIFTLFLGRMSGIAPAGSRTRCSCSRASCRGRFLAEPRGGRRTASSRRGAPDQGLLSAADLPARGGRLAHRRLRDRPRAPADRRRRCPGSGPQPTWLAARSARGPRLVAALAVGLWLAALNVRYRDFRYAIPFLVQLWFFATPIAYGAEAIPERVARPARAEPDGRAWSRASAGRSPAASPGGRTSSVLVSPSRRS